MRLDLHVHSTRSPDSSLRLSDIVDALGVNGLQGFALTDHNTIEGHPALREIAARFPRYRFIPAVEVSTEEGHLLVYGNSGAPTDPAAARRDARLDEGAWARDLAGPSPAAEPRGRRRIASSAPVTALETMNGHNRGVPNARAALLAARRGIGETGGSDAHSRSDLGRAATEFRDERLRRRGVAPRDLPGPRPGGRPIADGGRRGSGLALQRVETRGARIPPRY